MRLLLDTQVALWWLTASSRLSKSSRELMISSPCAVSVASVWEVDLKHRLGKLPITPLRFRDEMRSAGATILSVTDEHVLTRVQAAESHRDPFDRLLIAQSQIEGMQLVSADNKFAPYGIPIVW